MPPACVARLQCTSQPLQGPGAYVTSENTLVATINEKAPTDRGTSSFLSTSKRSELVNPTSDSYDVNRDLLMTAQAQRREVDDITPRLLSEQTVDLHRAGPKPIVSKKGA